MDSWIFDWDLNALQMVNVARYWESISNKTKILFGAFAKKTQSTFGLDNDSTYETNDGPNEKKNTLFVPEKSNRENWMKWRHEYVDQTQPFWYQCIPLFWCCLMLISNHLANVLQQYSLVYSELYQTSKMKPFTRKVTKKNSTPIKNIWLFYDFRDRGKKGLQRLINLLTIASC